MTVPVLCSLFARFVRSLRQARESTTRCLQRIQGHRAPTMTKLVEGEGAIASRRGITKLRSLAKATILGQGKLAVENWQTFGIAHWFSALEQLTTPSSCSKTVCISGKHYCSNVLHEEEEENSTKWAKTEWSVPFNSRSITIQPVHRSLFLKRHPLYGWKGGTSYRRLLYIHVAVVVGLS